MCGDGCNDCGALKTAHAGKIEFVLKPELRWSIFLNIPKCQCRYLFRHIAFNGWGLCGRPLHLQECEHLLRSLRHQVFPPHQHNSFPREGRATMVSAFASFKFGVAFCFTQLISVLMVFYVSEFNAIIFSGIISFQIFTTLMNTTVGAKTTNSQSRKH